VRNSVGSALERILKVLRRVRARWHLSLIVLDRVAQHSCAVINDIHKVKGNITKEKLQAFRRSATNKTGWSTARIDKWLAGRRAGRSQSTPAMKTPASRDAAIARGHEDPNMAEFATVREIVRKGPAGQVEGTLEATTRSDTPQVLQGSASEGQIHSALPLPVEGHSESDSDDEDPHEQWKRDFAESVAAPGRQAPILLKVGSILEHDKKLDQFYVLRTLHVADGSEAAGWVACQNVSDKAALHTSLGLSSKTL
jgi:hypothetical protein